jgi:hypothetical protein
MGRSLRRYSMDVRVISWIRRVATILCIAHIVGIKVLRIRMVDLLI